MDTTSLLETATKIAETRYRGAEYKADLYASWQALYRTPRRKSFLFGHGGAAVATGFRGRMTEDEAVEWLTTADLAHHDAAPTEEEARALLRAD